MATYVPDPTNVSEPLDTRAASTAAAEFRALKTYLTAVVAGGLPPVAGKNGWTLQADTAIPGAKWVNVKSLPDQAGNAGSLLKTDGTDASWATFYSFLPSLAGQGNKLVRVNTAQTALEYATFFSQFPVGSPGAILRLRSGGTEVEWTDAPALGVATASLAATNSNTNQLATTAWVRQAQFVIPDTVGVNTLFGIIGALPDYLQAIRENIRYIKETQIPNAANAYTSGNAASSTKASSMIRLDNPASTWAYDGTAPGAQRTHVIMTSDSTTMVPFPVSSLAVGSASTASFATSAGTAGSAATANLASHLNSTSHAGVFWMDVGWDGTYWVLSTNHGAAVKAGYADSAGTAGSAGSASTAGSAAVWTTARNITVGSQTRSVNGGSDVNFDLASMGAQATITGNGLTSITLTTTTGSPGGGAAGSIVGVY